MNPLAYLSTGLRACILLLTLAALSPQLLAQPERERWYQVEVIAFSRADQAQGEFWPHNIKLEYPAHWVELKTLSRESAAETADAAPEIDPGHTPFLLLPTSEHQLNRQASSLNRRHRVLLHQAWRQPPGTPRNTPWVLLAGGDAYGQHRELEGSIHLGAGQVLELKTRVWLTQFTANEGQTPGDWPSLPQAPNQVQATEELPPGMEDPLEIMRWQEMRANAPDAETANTFLPTRIVLLEDERRVRLNELHYIDHPLLGVLVQVTAVEPGTTPQP